jgi:hypothetical protein
MSQKELQSFIRGLHLWADLAKKACDEAVEPRHKDYWLKPMVSWLTRPDPRGGPDIVVSGPNFGAYVYAIDKDKKTGYGIGDDIIKASKVGAFEQESFADLRAALAGVDGGHDAVACLVKFISTRMPDFKLNGPAHADIRAIADTLKALAQAKPGAAKDAASPESRALALLIEHPDWTDTDIAKAVGVHRTTLYDWPKFKMARKAQVTGELRVQSKRSSRRSDRINAAKHQEENDGE